jgi:hypothetical protein
MTGRGRLGFSLAVFAICAAVAPAVVWAAIPETTITSGPAEGSVIPGPTATFAFSSTATPPVYHCTVDGAPVNPDCTSPFTTPALADGPHTFTVAAQEQGTADVDLTPATVHFKVGHQLPVTLVTKKPLKLRKDGTFDIGVQCPATSPVDCSGEFSVSCCSGKATLQDVNIVAPPRKLSDKGIRKHISPTLVKRPLTVAAGQTVTYRAKAGKTGSARLGASAARVRAGAKGLGPPAGFKVTVIVTQPGAPTVPGTDSSLVQKLKVQAYSAKQGKSGSAKK